MIYFEDNADIEVSKEKLSLSLVTPEIKNDSKGDCVTPEYCSVQTNCKSVNPLTSYIGP